MVAGNFYRRPSEKEDVLHFEIALTSAANAPACISALRGLEQPKLTVIEEDDKHFNLMLGHFAVEFERKDGVAAWAFITSQVCGEVYDEQYQPVDQPLVLPLAS